MADIIPFQRPEPREPDDPHAAGPAICLECRHEWVAVAPWGKLNFDCPACGTGKGVWRYPFKTRGTVMICNAVLDDGGRCFNDAFEIRPTGVYCYRCGSHHKPFS